MPKYMPMQSEIECRGKVDDGCLGYRSSERVRDKVVSLGCCVPYPTSRRLIEVSLPDDLFLYGGLDQMINLGRHPGNIQSAFVVWIV